VAIISIQARRDDLAHHRWRTPARASNRVVSGNSIGPAVAEAAVFGVPHELWGEVGCVFVVRETGHPPGHPPGHAIEAAELDAFLRERLAKYKVPHRIGFVGELPKTGVGKLDKKRLAALAQDAAR
jgi:fatty-acyl-CoA synthase